MSDWDFEIFKPNLDFDDWLDDYEDAKMIGSLFPYEKEIELEYFEDDDYDEEFSIIKAKGSSRRWFSRELTWLKHEASGTWEQYHTGDTYITRFSLFPITWKESEALLNGLSTLKNSRERRESIKNFEVLYRPMHTFIKLDNYKTKDDYGDGSTAMEYQIGDSSLEQESRWLNFSELEEIYDGLIISEEEKGFLIYTTIDCLLGYGLWS